MIFDRTGVYGVAWARIVLGKYADGRNGFQQPSRQEVNMAIRILNEYKRKHPFKHLLGIYPKL